MAQESDPNRQQKESVHHSAIIPQLQSKILAFKDQVIRYILLLSINRFYLQTVLHLVSFLFHQLTGGTVKEVWQIDQPMKVLHNLLLTSDPEKSYQISPELGLPHVLFDLIHTVVNSKFIKVTAQQ